MNTSDWVAIYAAIVATGALFLEIRRWFEDGPKVILRAAPNMMIIGGSTDEHDLIAITATNRGNAPTTITNLTIHRYQTLTSRLRNKADKNYIIPNPQMIGRPRIIPHQLLPGNQWTGFVRERKDILPDILDGSYWAAISTTDRNAPYYVRIRRSKTQEKIEGMKKLNRR